jgi:uncharacterized protein YjbI with pentapeptide repeats
MVVDTAARRVHQLVDVTGAAVSVDAAAVPIEALPPSTFSSPSDAASSVSLAGSDFSECWFASDVQVCGDITGCSFVSCILSGVSFDRVFVTRECTVSFARSDLSFATMTHDMQRARGMALARVDCTRCDLSCAVLRDCTFGSFATVDAVTAGITTHAVVWGV